MPTAPVSAYGRPKLAGEQGIQESGCKYLIFRTTWLYSEYGNNFLIDDVAPNVRAGDAECGLRPDQHTNLYRGPALVIFSNIEGERYTGSEGMYHFSDEGVCSWYDFTVEIAAAAGHDKCRITPCRTSEFPTKAVRPAYSVLDKTKVKTIFEIEIPYWRESMLYCLEQLTRQQA